MIDIHHYSAPEDLLKNKIIVVTGAGSGIGRSAALAFAKHGASVVLVGRTMANLESVYDEIEADGGAQPAIFPMNFESAVEQDYQALHDALKDTFGRLDGLLNNASELGSAGTLLSSYNLTEWNKVLQVNLTASFMVTKTLLPLLRHDRPSSVVFTSSSVGRNGRAFWGAYAVSKAATENLMQVFADELEGVSQIRVNSINPGATRSKMRAKAYPAEDPMTLPSGDDIMPAYLYLMGKDSEHCHGLQLNAQAK